MLLNSMKYKLLKKDAEYFERDGIRGYNYNVKKIEPNSSFIYAELVKPHGKVRTDKHERVYYIVQGKGIFFINGKKITVKKEDMVIIPPNTDYDYKPLTKTLKVLLFSEYRSYKK